MTREAKNMTRADSTRHDASAGASVQVMTHMTRSSNLSGYDASNSASVQVMTHMAIYDAYAPISTTNAGAHTQVRDTNPGKRVIASYASWKANS